MTSLHPHHLRRPFKATLPLLLLFHLSLSAQILDPSDPEVRREIGDHFGPGATGPFQARNGMVTTASHHATMAGLETLRGGGNAIDALAVVQFVLTVAEPYASGIGGGMFAVIHDADSGEIITVDGREEAPREFHPDAFRDEEGEVIPFRHRTIGGNSVGVPGTLATVAYLLDNYGTLTLAEALEPAIKLARDGFRLPEAFAANLHEQWDRIEHYPATVALYSREDGTPLQAGDHFRNPDLAETLELIAEKGVAILYTGELGEEIVATVRNDPHHPGVMTREDLANYRPVRREPVGVAYRGYEVYGMNMPSSGAGTIGLALNILEETGFADADPGSPKGMLPFGGADSIHRLADAQNLAFADRNRYMGDADFADVPLAGLLDQGYARERAELTDPEEAVSAPVAPGQPEGAGRPTPASNTPEGPSTTHFCIVDADRNVVSVTSTIEQHFGSGMVVPGRGFLLNNELTDFDAEARDDDGNLVPNAPEGEWRPRRTALGDAAETEGGKRPRSSMSPTIVLRDGEPVLAVGSPGGSRIIGITLNVLLNVLDHNMDVQAAINAPRVIARNGPLELEAPLYRDSDLRQTLEQRGFETENIQAVGAVQAIAIDGEGWIHGAADPRRAGLAVGY